MYLDRFQNYEKCVKNQKSAQTQIRVEVRDIESIRLVSIRWIGSQGRKKIEIAQIRSFSI